MPSSIFFFFLSVVAVVGFRRRFSIRNPRCAFKGGEWKAYEHVHLEKEKCAFLYFFRDHLSLADYR